MSKYANENNGIRFLITCIDTFSKKKRGCFSLNDKSGLSIDKVMRAFLLINRPNKIEFDQGTEFNNRHVLRLLKTYGIHHYSIYSDRKCGIVERFNRKIKNEDV